MDQKIEGAWLVHHTNKLQSVTNQQDFEDTFLAGKSGILLSAISSEDTLIVDNEKLKVLAKASNINAKLELPAILPILREKNLIEIGQDSIEVLGVTSSATLKHTSDIFQDFEPSKSESAAILLAERASQRPLDAKQIREELSDTFSLASSSIDYVLDSSEKIGFIDVENVDDSTKIYFNGNLFRRQSAQKTKIVLESLKPIEQIKLTEVIETLKTKACLSVEEVRNILGDKLFNKVQIDLKLVPTFFLLGSTCVKRLQSKG